MWCGCKLNPLHSVLFTIPLFLKDSWTGSKDTNRLRSSLNIYAAAEQEGRDIFFNQPWPVYFIAKSHRGPGRGLFLLRAL